MIHIIKRHQKFWDMVALIAAGCLYIGALNVDTSLSVALLLVMAVSISLVPVYRLRYPNQELPLPLKIFNWLTVIAVMVFIGWCLFWLAVVFAFVHSDWQF